MRALRFLGKVLLWMALAWLFLLLITLVFVFGA
jgi:hypothetical protein